MLNEGEGQGKQGALSSIFGNSSAKAKKEPTYIKPGSSSREANPYFRNGGSGLPPASALTADNSTQSSESGKTIETADLNVLTARKLKAELKGDTESAKEIERQIKELQSSSYTVVKPFKVDKETSYDLMKEDLLKEERERREAKRADLSDYATALIKEIEDDGAGDSAARRNTPKPVSRDGNKTEYLKGVLHHERVQKSCQFCLKDEPNTLIIALGTLTYLAIPQRHLLGDLHLRIVPTEHCASTLRLEDDTMTEVRNFKKCIIRMAASLGREAIFLESVHDASSERAHAYIDAVVLPRGQQRDLRAYYKKALEECDSEWATHKGIIETNKIKGGFRKSIPPKFPFLHVETQLDHGLVHVIEDTHKISRDFLIELTVPLVFESSAKRADFRNTTPTTDYVTRVKSQYGPFDWTPLLQDDGNGQ